MISWSKKKSIVVACILCAVLAAAAAGWMFLRPMGIGAENGEGVWVQSVSTLSNMGTLGADNYFAGIVETQQTVKIQRDTNRTLKDTYVQTGDTIQKGEKLFEYDSQESEMALEKAKIEAQQLQNSISSYQSQLETLQKQLNQASSTEEKLTLTEEIQNMEATISQTQYDLKVKQLEVEEQEKSQQETVVLSPIDGVVKSVGSNNGYSDGSDSAYITLMSLGDFRVKCSINETNMGSVAEGDIVTVYSRVDDTKTWTGTVAQIETGAVEEDNTDGSMGYSDGSGNEMLQSSSYAFYVTLDNEDGLLIGQHVYVKSGLPQTTEESGESDEPALTLSEDYLVIEENGDAYVWVANSRGKLEKRSVTLGEHREESYCYVIEDGLTADDYVAYPDPSLEGGEPVMYQESDTPDAGTDSEEPVIDEEIVPETGGSVEVMR